MFFTGHDFQLAAAEGMLVLPSLRISVLVIYVLVIYVKHEVIRRHKLTICKL